MKINLQYEEVKTLFVRHGYPLKPNEITPFGLRSKDRTTDKWNDTLGLMYPGNKVMAFSGTTDPGASPLSSTEGVNANGIFILMPGYYENCWHRGQHKGRYNALVQFGSGVFRGWRDDDRDGILDMTGKIWTDVQGLNFHTTRWDKQVVRVGEFSHGCQVTEVAKEYDQMIEVVWPSPQKLFSYALFDMAA